MQTVLQCESEALPLDAQEQERIQTKREACVAYLENYPDDRAGLHMLGVLEGKLGRPDAAAACFERALAKNPATDTLLYHYALILFHQEKFAEAVVKLRQAQSLAPEKMEIPRLLGSALTKLGDIQAAMDVYRQALTVDPQDVQILNSLGILLMHEGEPAEALVFYRRAIEKDPTYYRCYNNAALANVSLGHSQDAEMLARKAIELKPDYAQAFNTLGIVFMARGQFAAAREWYRKALAVLPDYAEAHNNLGNALKNDRQAEAAIAHYKRSLQIKEYANARYNMAEALLSLGRFDEGWVAYEARLENMPRIRAHPAFRYPRWREEEGEGRTLLLICEQGFGDMIQFCRYASWAQAKGWRVILEAPAALARLMQSLQGVDQIIVKGVDALPPFDAYCPVLSQPFVWKTRPDTIPCDVPYLNADPQAVGAWRARLPEAGGRLRVGLVWQGDSSGEIKDLASTNFFRSATPEVFAPLLDVPGVQFYSLQKIGRPAPESFGLIDFMSECIDFADTAALVENLDLVITVDTAMAHLTGALGKPVWMLNRYNTCWRWFWNREDSPWYPSMRIFRQETSGDWPGVVTRAREALLQRASLMS